jgi:hypothetical protein
VGSGAWAAAREVGHGLTRQREQQAGTLCRNSLSKPAEAIGRNSVAAAFAPANQSKQTEKKDQIYQNDRFVFLGFKSDS